MDRKSTLFSIIVVVSIFVSIAATYYRRVVIQDFAVEASEDAALVKEE